MASFTHGDVALNFTDHGPKDAPVLVMAHSLGCDQSMFDAALPLLPQGMRVVTFDMRGHGKSAVTPAPYAMGRLIGDAEALLTHLGLREVTFLGVSIGGMIAQGLAVKRLDLVRALVLVDTAVKIGTAEMWQQRIDAVRAGGLVSIAGQVMARWFPPAFIAAGKDAVWRAKLAAMSPEGYVGACAAIAGTDLLTPTSGLRLPTLAIAGSEDRSTPPDLVRELADLIPGARFALIRGAGHLPPIDRPAEFAALVAQFLDQIGQIPA